MSNNRESGSSISKLNLSSRSPTPTPCELRPIYEAESPDELALVDAAFAYNCKLLKRSPGHAVVSLPGEGLVEFEVICEKGFSNFSCMFLNPKNFSNLNSNCSNSLGIINLEEQD